MISPRRCALAILALLISTGTLAAQDRIGDLTTAGGDIPRRLVGYGIVIGLDGTGDRTFGSLYGTTPTVRSIVNLLRRFNLEVPPQQLRPRNVAAVMVTAEVSPYLRAGGRFDIQVASLGDAVSLQGGVLFMTPLMTDVNEPPVGTAQGAVLVAQQTERYYRHQGNSGRIPDGGILEVDPAPSTAGPLRLILREPDLGTAVRMVAVINSVHGAEAATALDPGSIALKPPASMADNPLRFLAAVDTLQVSRDVTPQLLIDARDGTIVAGGDVRIGAATVSHKGITLTVGMASPAPSEAGPTYLMQMPEGVTVHEVAAGLHAVGATTSEISSIFEALKAVGALAAEVHVR